MPVKNHNPPRTEDEIVQLNIAIGQQRELTEFRDEINEWEDHLALKR